MRRLLLIIFPAHCITMAEESNLARTVFFTSLQVTQKNRLWHKIPILWQEKFYVLPLKANPHLTTRLIMMCIRTDIVIRKVLHGTHKEISGQQNTADQIPPATTK